VCEQRLYLAAPSSGVSTIGGVGVSGGIKRGMEFIMRGLGAGIEAGVGVTRWFWTISRGRVCAALCGGAVTD